MLKKIKKILIKLKNKLWFKIVLQSDEFSPKLDLDHKKMIKMSKEKRMVYVKDIMRKREIAHELDLLD